MPRIASTIAEENIRTRLRRVGLRATSPRVRVYRILEDRRGHWSVDDIVAFLAEEGARIPRMSVYNVVADLQRTGLVMCADTGPGRALYEVNEIWHHHFVCRICAAVIDVPCVVGEKPCLDLPKPPGRVDEAQVIFRGVCDECQNAGRDAGRPITHHGQRARTDRFTSTLRRGETRRVEK